MTVTKQMLQDKIDYLNYVTNSPDTPYTRDDSGKLSANIGCFTLYQAYGEVGLHRMVNEGGGITDRHIYGLHSKKELYALLSAFINGVEFNA